MGVSCQIYIRRPKEGVHKAGRSVTGIVKYSVDEPEEFRGILLSLVGKGICSWKDSRQTAKGLETEINTGTESYTSQCISLHDTGSASTFVLPVGTYEYSFRFHLPKDIPPSFENDVCSIKYTLILKFVNPNFFCTHKSFYGEINVFSYVKPHEGDTVFELQKTLFKPFKKKTHLVKLKAEILNTIFSPGQNIEFSYEVTNDTDVTIPSVKSELICNTTYTANSGKQKHSETVIKECTVETPSISNNVVANILNIMPTLPHLYSVQNCKIMVKKYKVKVTVRLPMPHLNASLEIPIVIGERYGNDYVERWRSVEEMEDEPPSYFETMNEIKRI